MEKDNKISHIIKDENQSWIGFTIELLVLIAIILFIRFWIFQFFQVSGPSMCPTLNMFNEECSDGKGEFIFVNEFLYNFVREPERGEIVVFKPPVSNHGRDYYIKRVVGVPGDIVEIKNGRIYISGKELPQQILEEDYLSELNQGTTTSDIKKFVVPDGHFLVFGDNRRESLDARRCFGSCDNGDDTLAYVPKDNIQGRAEFAITWPLNHSRWLDNNPYDLVLTTGE